MLFIATGTQDLSMRPSNNSITIMYIYIYIQIDMCVSLYYGVTQSIKLVTVYTDTINPFKYILYKYHGQYLSNG